MGDYADVRTLVIKQAEDARVEEELHTVTIIRFYSDVIDTHDAIPDKIYDEISSINTKAYENKSSDAIDGYFVEDKRVVYEYGASAAFQEVILSVSSGVAGAAATFLIERLVTWAKQKFDDADVHQSRLEDSIDRAKELVLQRFGSQGILTVLESISTETHSKVKIKDSRGIIYEVKTQHTPPYTIQARRMK